MNQNKKQTNCSSFHLLFWYFLLFSILGFLIETFYCYFTTGVWESRKGLLWGPFCPIYGVGACFLILFLQRYKGHPFKLFVFGFLLGSFFEYIASYVLEAIYQTRFWDYSYLPFHLNGRICITYSIFWGILSLFLIESIRPFLNQFIFSIAPKVRNILELFLICFFVVNTIVTIYGISKYKEKAILLYEEKGLETYQDSRPNFLSDEKIKKAFPNLRFMNQDGTEIWIRDIL